MDDFYYSPEAENIINLFYQSEVMVYVEGPDDICFWETIFNKVSSLKVEVQDVGGCTEVDKYIERIIKEDLNIIVACDADLKIFKGINPQHTRVIRTPGYAIENSFITQEGVLKAIKTLGKISRKTVSEIDISAWNENFYSSIEHLIKLDIYNYIHDKGIPVIGDSSDRFMKTKDSNELCSEKISAFRNQVTDKMGDFDIEEVNTLIHQLGTDYKRWLRGHFLFSATHRLISTLACRSGKKVSLSHESLYSNLITNFESAFSDTHPDYYHYQSKISEIRL